MKPRLLPLKNFSTQENQRLVLPALSGAIVLLIVIAYFGMAFFRSGGIFNLILLLIGLVGTLYTLTLFFFILARPERIEKVKWSIAIVGGIGLGAVFVTLPSTVDHISIYLGVLAVISMAIIAGRWPTYLMLAIYFAFTFIGLQDYQAALANAVFISGYLLVAVITAESILYLIKSTHERIDRLETINAFARNISGTVEMPQVINLLNAALQNAINADTYFIGVLDEDGLLNVDLLYDDGEYFPPSRRALEGTLAGWVIRNNRPLFLPDLRREPELDGVTKSIIGHQRLSLSWMGAPMNTAHLKAIIAVASYNLHAFDRMDMELLENLAQQAGLSLDNAYHHTDVEHQSRLDSLTGVYNHGYFLKLLGEFSQEAMTNRTPLSLIMLDVDHFKAYNDDFGHVYGDEVLCMLTQAIQNHIKHSDAVGRWGGEEFAIALPNASGYQALRVARRIQHTMVEMQLEHPKKGKVPVPTVSQGIALFPMEAKDVFSLVDFADQRLYVAKARGRNQIEPDEASWEKTRPLASLMKRK
jgi:diguanylate cyclase (GGDEF)-like protein